MQFPDWSWELWGLRRRHKYNCKDVPRQSSTFAEVFCKKFILLIITPSQRGSTTGLVMSGYGLSAFLFSTISHIFFVGSLSPFLLMLSLGASFPMILGFFFVRQVTLPEEEANRDDYSETSVSAYEQRNSISSRTPFLDHEHHIDAEDDDDVHPNPLQNCETSRLNRGASMKLNMLPNVYSRKLFCNRAFWLLFAIHSICTFVCSSGSLFISDPTCIDSGTGLMCMSSLNNEHSLVPF